MLFLESTNSPTLSGNKDELNVYQSQYDDVLRKVLLICPLEMVGQILRKDMGNIMKEASFWTPDGKRKRGRSTKITWRSTRAKELVSVDLSRWGQKGGTGSVQLEKITVEALCVAWHDKDQ